MPARVSPATGYIDNTACRIGRFIGHKPEYSLGNFFRRADALHRDIVFNAFNAIRLTAAGMDLGVYDARPYGIHAYAIFRHFPGQALRKGINSALGRGIVYVFTR